MHFSVCSYRLSLGAFGNQQNRVYILLIHSSFLPTFLSQTSPRNIIKISWRNPLNKNTSLLNKTTQLLDILPVLLLAYPSNSHDFNVVTCQRYVLSLGSPWQLRGTQHRKIKSCYLLFLPRHNYVACHYNAFSSLLRFFIFSSST